MKPFSSEEIRKIVNGKLIQGRADLIIAKASYHIENMNESNMLLFLRTTNNINFEIISRYVPCVVVTDKNLEPLRSIDECAIILVENIEIAFWAFVYHYRKLFQIPVVAITGTCGKSTTKDMIKHILKNKLNVIGTYSSANSRTHHFHYLLLIDETTDVAVFETAVGKPGDLANSCKYFKPTIGIITNISLDHLEGCKTLDKYIKAKGELLSGISNDGVLIINADDENIKKLDLHIFKGCVVYFSINNSADFQAANIEFAENGMKFTLVNYQKKYQMFVPGYGKHQVYNALAALAAVHELGISMTEASVFLQTFRNLPLHIQVNPGINGSTIISDTWNTNPASLKAAIQVLSEISNGRKRIALIGDINALGETTLEIHRQVGDMIVETVGVDTLITIGPLAAEAANQALRVGFKGEIYKFPNVHGVYDLLKSELNSNAILLVKSAGYHDKTILDLTVKLREC